MSEEKKACECGKDNGSIVRFGPMMSFVWLECPDCHGVQIDPLGNEVAR